MQIKPTPWVESGPGRLKALPELTAMLRAEPWLAVLDQAIADQLGPLVVALLGDRLAAVLTYGPGEPTVAALDQLAADARVSGAQGVIGVGGGSAMDAAKGIAVLLTNPGSAADYQGFGLVQRQGAPLVLAPTTAGSGSEATWSAVLINQATGIKRGINGPEVFARAAILDPELTLSLPPPQTAASGMDALIHAIESYVAANATRYSRMYAAEAMRLIFPALPRAVRDGADRAARGDLLLGAHFAGIAIASSEVGLSHALSYPLSVRYGIPHGLGNALLIARSTKFNAPACPDLYDEVGELTGAAGVSAVTIADFLDRYVHDLGISESLGSFGMRPEHLDELVPAALGLRGPLDNNRRDVDERAVHEIYAASL
jgi:alcohol dehydrogenase